MADHRWDTSPSVPQLSPSGETGTPALRPRRRWILSQRAAVLAVCLLLGAGAALMVAKADGPAADITSVELTADRRVPAAGEQPGGTEKGGGSEEADGGTDSRNEREDAYQNQSPAQPQEAGGGKTGAPSGQGAPSVLVIHVAGAVAQPGVVRIPSGSRTGEAVEAAGGAASDADLTAVNLAAPLQDGMMVIVPRIGDETRAVPGGSGADGAGTVPGPDAGSGAGAGSGTGKEAPVNINSATAQELDVLPRVGPVLAERIIAWRTDHGRFARPEDLDAVPGIGEAMLAALLPLITV